MNKKCKYKVQLANYFETTEHLDNQYILIRRNKISLLILVISGKVS